MQDLQSLEPLRLQRGIRASTPPAISARPLASVAPAAPPTTEQGGLPSALVLGALGLAVLLLAVSSVPPWAVHGARSAALLERWRAQLAAAGLSTLAAAGIVFVLSHWEP